MTPFWNRNLVLWTIGTAQSQCGTALAGIALSFLVLHQTGSARQMALTLACTLLPQLLMPLAGAWVDRVPLRLPLIGADVARALLQLGLGVLALRGDVPLSVVNTVAVLTGLAGIFAGPASNAAVPSLVPPSQLARANGLLGSVSQGASLLGTLAGGWLVARFSPPMAILLNGGSFLVMATLLCWIRLPRRTVAPGPRQHLFADVRAGLGVMRRSRLLLLAPAIALLLNATLAPVTVVIPKLLAGQGSGAGGYGLFLSLESVGMLLSGLLIMASRNRWPSHWMIAIGLGLTAGVYSLIWRWPIPAVLLGSAPVLGLGFGLINIPFQTLLQRLVPEAYLGRVFSVLGMVSSLGMPISLLVISPMLDVLPMPVWFGAAALLQGLGGVVWSLAILRGQRTPEASAELSSRPTPQL
ncbi:MFS transporter [Deinococcus altitudinis]|uniref:MFS transporter n=1 Tax=Deinococcus altitudinis TaxID=468914 RepID=UPI003892C09F